MRLFLNRSEAARELARNLVYLKPENPVVLGLANGGAPVAEIIADELEAPRDIVLIEKLAAPNSTDHIVGAVDEHGRISLLETTARWHHLTTQQMVAPARVAFHFLQAKQGSIRSVLPEFPVRGRTVILVDEGVDTGARMLGAIASLRDRGVRKIIVAAPAGSTDATWQLHDAADVVVIPHRPSKFHSVDKFYQEYSPVSDEMLIAMVERWAATRTREQPGVNTILMKVNSTLSQSLSCEIDLPPGMKRGGGPYPAVIFVHGYESSSQSPRNLAISRRLAKRGVIGVRMDMTGHGTSEGTLEQATEVQAIHDLHEVFVSIRGLQEVEADHLGLVGSGEGGMIALHYAAQVSEVTALVIRGAVCGNEAEAAHRVQSPTLLIHAQGDTALEESVNILDHELAGAHKLLRIPESNRSFSDPISRELMVNATVEWLVDHLTGIVIPDEEPVIETMASEQPETEPQS